MASGESNSDVSGGNAGTASEAVFSSRAKSSSELSPVQEKSLDFAKEETVAPVASWKRAGGGETDLEQNPVERTHQPAEHLPPVGAQQLPIEQVKEDVGKVAHTVLHPGYEAIHKVRQASDENEEFIRLVLVVGERLVAANEAYKDFEDRLGVRYKQKEEGDK
jgi:hypothetical protein